LKAAYIGDPRWHGDVRVTGVEVYEGSTVIRWDSVAEDPPSIAIRETSGRVLTSHVASNENVVGRPNHRRGRALYASRLDIAWPYATLEFGGRAVPVSFAGEDSASLESYHVARFGNAPAADGLTVTLIELEMEFTCIHWHYLSSDTGSPEPEDSIRIIDADGAYHHGIQTAGMRLDDSFLGSTQFAARLQSDWQICVSNVIVDNPVVGTDAGSS
jgi:hypothetical protein